MTACGRQWALPTRGPRSVPSGQERECGRGPTFGLVCSFIQSPIQSFINSFIHLEILTERLSVCSIVFRVLGTLPPRGEKKEGGQQMHPQGGAESTPELAGVAWEGRAVLSEATGDLSEERTDTRLSPEARPVRTWWARQLQDDGGPVRTPWWCFG